MTRYSFIARMPDDPGSLDRAAEIVKAYEGNINRIHYDRRIDPCTVFFELDATESAYAAITTDLRRIGYLQTTLASPSFLKFAVDLPHRPGALHEFLNYTTQAQANIAFIDFDDGGKHPERVTFSMTLDDAGAADRLLTELRSRYRLEILEYDTTGEKLDDTVFYVRFAQKIRPLVGDAGDAFLLQLLQEINHIVQELAAIGKDPRQVFESILCTGRTLHATTGEGFYADVQAVRLPEGVDLLCIQPPCGGNVFLFSTAEEQVMIDTGYGCYHQDLRAVLETRAPANGRPLTRILVTHADADHSGAGGFYNVPALMHKGTLEIIEKANRAYGSRMASSILEEVYTELINLFSAFTSPKRPVLFPAAGDERCGPFPVLDRIRIGPLEFTVLEGLGGHLYGQCYLACPEAGLLFTADSVINFASLTDERSRYNTYADFLMTTVNVDSAIARQERTALLGIARGIDDRLRPEGRRCLLACGHGAISVIGKKGLESIGGIERYPRPPPA